MSTFTILQTSFYTDLPSTLSTSNFISLPWAHFRVQGVLIAHDILTYTFY